MPVRVFTYLIGKDDSNAADMNWIACNNKGKYITNNVHKTSSNTYVSRIKRVRKPYSTSVMNS